MDPGTESARGPWIQLQRWHDLLFAHWPVPVESLRRLLPPYLELDTFDGRAWLGVIPFHMSGVRLHWLPPLPGVAAFPELNVRTYVRAIAGPGVWFFSLDAGSRLAVEVARAWYHLPYYHARMTVERSAAEVLYASERVDARGPAAAFRARYGPTTEPNHSTYGSLERWLTERYRLYAADRRGSLYSAEIDHAPWPLEPAAAEIEVNTMSLALGIRLPDRAPLLHFSRTLAVRIGPPRRLGVSQRCYSAEATARA